MNQAYIDEANKLSSAGVWIILLEISKTGYTTIRYTSDNAAAADPTHFSVDWNGNTYYAVPFALEDTRTSLKGELHEYGLRIEELSLTSTLRTMVKTSGGLVGGIVRTMVVHSGYLDTLTTSAVEMESEILDCTVTSDAVTFRLGIASPYKRRFPRERYMPGYCRHKFGGAMCRYQPPGYSLTSSQVQFIEGDGYNTIWVGDGGLVTDVFEHMPGRRECPGNLVTNGDFEDGETSNPTGWVNGHIDDWELWGNADDTERRWSSDKAMYGGSKSYYHTPDEEKGQKQDAGIKQTIQVVNKTWYTVSCWVFVQGGGTNSLWIKVRLLGEDIPATPTKHSEWEKISFSFYNEYLLGGLDVCIGGIGAAYFDAVSVVEGNAAGEYNRYGLKRDTTAFTVSGSQSNDGAFLADNYHAVGENYVRILPGDKVDGVFVEEAAGNEVTISLGYTGCTHTLEDCKLRSNLQNYGGSPGISGGAYG